MADETTQATETVNPTAPTEPAPKPRKLSDLDRAKFDAARLRVELLGSKAQEMLTAAGITQQMQVEQAKLNALVKRLTEAYDFEPGRDAIDTDTGEIKPRQ